MTTNQLSKVYDTTLLSSRLMYQIDGVLYRYLYRSDSISHPQFTFVPLGGQRKTAIARINRTKVLTRVYEVKGMSAKSEVSGNNLIQMTLF